MTTVDQLKQAIKESKVMLPITSHYQQKFINYEAAMAHAKFISKVHKLFPALCVYQQGDWIMVDSEPPADKKIEVDAAFYRGIFTPRKKKIPFHTTMFTSLGNFIADKCCPAYILFLVSSEDQRITRTTFVRYENDIEIMLEAYDTMKVKHIIPTKFYL